jgi:sterol desaturase/sphingolipid hydroxylase (fatty acid hydroxylase superfamily)
LIAYAVPVFLLSIALELHYAREKMPRVYEWRDTWTSLFMGIGAVVVGLPFRFAFLWVLTLVYQHRLFTVPETLLGYVALLFAEDLCYYASHRTNHEVRLFWAGHVNHHSSEHYQLATALRQSWTQPYLMWIFWLPLPLLGFSPKMILLQQGISLVYQFFIHTQLVGKLGPLEWVMNTPSHHRVHHATNVRYLDRNHAGIFIIWDRLFGTFQAEIASDPPVYGITKNLGSFNLMHVAFHEWVAIARDVQSAPGLLNKLKYVFAPPGYSHDGSRMTSKQMQKLAKLRMDSVPPAFTSSPAADTAHTAA